MRGFEIYAPEIDRIFDSEELSSLMFRDSQLKNGSKLVLCEPDKNKDSDEESGEDEMMEEGGEDEQDDMNEENEEEEDGDN